MAIPDEPHDPTCNCLGCQLDKELERRKMPMIRSVIPLRDLFAGCALIAYCHPKGTGTFEETAQASYQQADAMLAAREEKSDA